MKPINTPQQLLSKVQEDAISWYADQQVEAALKEGIVTPDQSQEHWVQSAGDLLDDTELLVRMVTAYQRFEKTGDGDGMSVVLEHYGMLHNAVDEIPTAQQIETLMADRRKPGRNAARVAAALTMASSMGVLPAQTYANGLTVGSRPVPIRRQYDLPPAPPPRPVQEECWAKRSKKDEEPPQIC